MSAAPYPTHRMTWIKFIAESLQRRENLLRTPKPPVGGVPKDLQVWNALTDYVHKQGPNGSGIDNGTFIHETSTSKRVVLITAFHHMNDHGTYCGWSEHKLIITPEFTGFDLKITGRDRNGIKDYLGDLYHSWLSSEAEHPALVEYIHS